MMFKSLTVFQATAPSGLDFTSIEDAFKQSAFVPGGAQQEKSAGWAPPRGSEHDAYLEAIAGHWLAVLKIETRSVPATELKKRVDAMAQAVEDETGRKPGRKHLKELKEDALAQLLPNAFAKTVSVPVWIDPQNGTFGIGSTTQSKLDEVVTALVRCVPNLSLAEAAQRGKTVAAMREWLMQEDDEQMPAGMSLGTECVLRHDGEGKATARFTNQDLACEEVRQNLRSGKEPIALGLCWGERVELVLQASGRLKGIHVSADTGSEAGEKDVGELDADFALFTGEMVPVIEQLRQEVEQVSKRIESARGASDAAIKGIASMWGAGQGVAEAAA